MKKVMTILGTRPEIIRLSEVIKKFDQEFEHILVHTGQNYDYELNEIFFEELGLRRPDFFLNTVGKDLGETMGNILAKSYEIIQKEKPDCVCILGDTNSALSAISAKRLKCPIFHMEAGNRCWDWNVAEMTNRVIVDHIADINLPYSEFAKSNLIREGLPERRIIKTGSPMKEVLMAHEKEIEASKILEKLHLKKDGYLVFSAHREENVDNEKKMKTLFTSLNEIAEELKMPVIFSCHPRTRKRLEKAGIRLSSYIVESKPFGFFEYGKLQRNAYVVLSDSGSLTEESAICHFPALLIRTSTERQEGVIAHAISIPGIEKEAILKAIPIARKRAKEGRIAGKIAVPDYDIDDVSIRVVDCIKKYTNVVLKETWNRS